MLWKPQIGCHSLRGATAMSDCQEHFADDVYLSYLRRLLPPEQAAALQEHVDRACRECLQSLSLWGQVLDRAEAESTYEAPEGVVSAAKAAFALRQKVPLLSRLAQTTRLVFDSLREPLPEGIRAGVAAPQHLLHESDGVLIDLRLEAESDRQVCLAGQVVGVTGAEKPAAAAAIALVQGDNRLVAIALANMLGEFQLRYKRRRDLTLFLDVPGCGIIKIPLPGSNGPGEAVTGDPAVPLT